MEKITLDMAMYRWFEMKYRTYDKLEHGNSIYLYYDGEEYADIRILNKNNLVIYNIKFYDEFSELFPIELNDFEEIILNWIKDTFNLNDIINILVRYGRAKTLKTPL